jgi:hypothetical protein
MREEPRAARLVLLKRGAASAEGVTRARASVCSGICWER